MNASRTGPALSRRAPARPDPQLTEQDRSAQPPSRPDGRAEPAWLASCTQNPLRQSALDPEVNGLIPDEDLCELPADDLHLRRDAAAAWWRLSTRYQKDLGEPMCATDAYRDLASQEQLYAAKPGLAAAPGTSNHGWGIALDLCGGAESFGTPESLWLVENAESLGWANPDWAQATGSKPEPWHWEFVG